MTENMNITKFDKKIYISHAFGGKKKNLKDVEKIVKQLIKTYPNYLFISPIHSFSFEYYMDDYDYGLSKCLALLDICDEVWVTGKNYQDSKGVFEEMVYAHSNKIPVKYMSFEDEKDTIIADWENYNCQAKVVSSIREFNM